MNSKKLNKTKVAVDEGRQLKQEIIHLIVMQ